MTTFQELHRIACESGADAYSDPMTGYRVFTELKLLRQGDCCGNACRHCPFGHIKVSNLESEPRIQKPVVLGSLKGRCDSFDVLFWSGGKDSFLCLSHLLENDRNIVLLTTFSVDNNRVPIQNIHIKDIVQQASFFNVPVCLLPILPNANYRDTVCAGLRAIEMRIGTNVTRICFGDLHLQDLRNWRVETWPQYEVFTPLFGRPYQELLELLWKSASQYDVSIQLSTEVQLLNAVLPIGTTYDKALVERLQNAGVDAMLEFGEGHTQVLPNRTMTNQSVCSQYQN